MVFWTLTVHYSCCFHCKSFWINFKSCKYNPVKTQNESINLEMCTDTDISFFFFFKAAVSRTNSVCAVQLCKYGVNNGVTARSVHMSQWKSEVILTVLEDSGSAIWNIIHPQQWSILVEMGMWPTGDSNILMSYPCWLFLCFHSKPGWAPNSDLWDIWGTQSLKNTAIMDNVLWIHINKERLNRMPDSLTAEESDFRGKFVPSHYFKCYLILDYCFPAAI